MINEKPECQERMQWMNGLVSSCFQFRFKYSCSYHCHHKMKHTCMNDFMETYDNEVNNKWLLQRVWSQNIDFTFYSLDLFSNTVAILNFVVLNSYYRYGMLRKQIHTNLLPLALHNSYLKHQNSKWLLYHWKGPLGQWSNTMLKT